MSETAPYIEFGIIGRPKGLHGTVRVQLYNPKSDYLSGAQTITVREPNGGLRSWDIDSIRPGSEPGVVLMNTPQIEDRTDAEKCRGWVILVQAKDLPTLSEDEFYYHEVAGATVVTPTGMQIGSIIEAIETNRTIFSIRTVEGGELLIPVTQELVLEIDLSKKTVVVVEDLLDRFEEVL